ncbi:MAG TPA: hypothetical protein VN578_08010 [Candidatus Binatia bacterium]|jgi:Tfp pilus assembly protein PilW|nr:hypothetical protein [Candidatus Binatia bacterium]
MKNFRRGPQVQSARSLQKAMRAKGSAVSGFTILEAVVALGLGTMVLGVVAILTVYGLFSFAAMGNYTDLDSQSRNTLDVLNRELRQATAVIDMQTNLPVRSLTLTNTDVGQNIKLTWDSRAQTLVMAVTGQPTRTYLTKCSDWNFALFNRAPTVSSTNITFNTAGNLGDAKLINMSWKCSRPVLVGQRVNTESVQTAQVVLRNDVSD